MRRLFGKAGELVLRFWAGERGSLDQLVWAIGGAVVVVLIVIGLMRWAPDTVQSIWQSFIGYMRGTFGF